MHILFIGYGKTSQRVAKHLFGHGHQISTISRSPKAADGANHLIQDIHSVDLSELSPIDAVYVLLTPADASVEAYQHCFVDSIAPLQAALAHHPIQRVIVVSSTRVYGENHGQVVDDETIPSPIDAQGQVLLRMEQAWQTAYPEQCIIVRPSGIYGTSIARMIKLAQSKQSYPNIHWSNRIHIDDLAAFLASLLHVEQCQSSYIVTNNLPMPLHQTIQWFQQQLGLPELQLQSEVPSGKKLYATRMSQSGFELKHPDCFVDYHAMMTANTAS